MSLYPEIDVNNLRQYFRILADPEKFKSEVMDTELDIGPVGNHAMAVGVPYDAEDEDFFGIVAGRESNPA